MLDCQLRYGSQKPLSVRMSRSREQFLYRRLLNYSPRVHHRYAIGDLCNYTEIMSD